MEKEKRTNRSVNGTGSIRQISSTKNGKTYTYWQGRVTTGYDPLTGKQVQRSLNGKTQKEVAQKMKEILHEVDLGAYIAPSKMTVGEWLEIWQADYLNGIKESSAHVYREIIRLYLTPVLGAVRLEALQPHMVQTLYNQLQHPAKRGQMPLAPKTIKNIHGVLRKALQQAVLMRYLRSNPTDACVLPRIERTEVQPMNETQIVAFLAAIKEHRHEYLYKIALYTGLREGEILGLTWDAIDLERGSLLVKQQLKRERKKGGHYYLSSTKNNKSRQLTLAPSVVALFRQQKQLQEVMRLFQGEKWIATNLVFTNEMGNYLSYRTVYDCFKRIVKKIGVPELRFHDLRHTYAVLALQNGDDVKTVQENLGHATSSFTLDVYGHVSSRMKDDSASRMENFILEINKSGERETGGGVSEKNGHER